MIVASIVTDVGDWLDKVSGHWWFLVVILVVALLDSVVPIVPSESAVIIGGVAAGSGQQHLALVILCASLGAFLGDNIAYLIGRHFSGRIDRYASARPKTRGRLDWADRQIRRRGGLLILTARFIPGGRTVITVSCGITRQPHRWFAMWTAIAAVIWATYAAGLGFVFGATFEDNHTIAFVLAFGAALAVSLVIELVRHVRNRGKDATADEPAHPERVGS